MDNNNKEKLFDKKTIIFLCAAFAVLLCLELCFANRTSLVLKAGGYTKTEINLDEAEVSGKVTVRNDGLYINGSGTLVFDVPDEELASFGFKCYGIGSFCNFTSYITDEGSAVVYRKTGTQLFKPDIDDWNIFPVDSSGKAKSIKIEFNDNCAGLYINKISVR
jgi:hypothetical protein